MPSSVSSHKKSWWFFVLSYMSHEDSAAYAPTWPIRCRWQPVLLQLLICCVGSSPSFTWIVYLLWRMWISLAEAKCFGCDALGCLSLSLFTGRDALWEQCSCAAVRNLLEEPVATVREDFVWITAVMALNHLCLQVISWLILKGQGAAVMKNLFSIYIWKKN